MRKISEKVVFFGSGPVAAKSLNLLIKNFEIEAVITKPAKSEHDPTPVLDVANQHHIRTHTPKNRSELDDLFTTKPVKSNLGILIDYGIIVSPIVVNYFSLGIINSHFSLLPEWRGADPISFAILSGQKETGVSLMLIDSGMDTGPVIDRRKIEINTKDTSVSLTAKLITLSDQMLNEDVTKYLNHEILPIAQTNDIKPTYSRKLTKEDGEINWHKPAKDIEREIRAYISWPYSTTKIKDKTVIITEAHVVSDSGHPGNFIIKRNEIIFFTAEEALSIDKLKPIGKKEMTASAFLSGYRNAIS